MSQKEFDSRNTQKNTQSEKKKARYVELATPKVRMGSSKRLNAFQVKPGALTYEITDSLNRLAQPKRKHSSNTHKYSNPVFLSSNPSLKPDNLSKVSSSIGSYSQKELSETNKAKVETYANIVARQNSRYPVYLRKFSRPVKNSPDSRTGNFNIQNKFARMMENYSLGKNLKSVRR